MLSESVKFFSTHPVHLRNTVEYIPVLDCTVAVLLLLEVSVVFSLFVDAVAEYDAIEASEEFSVEVLCFPETDVLEYSVVFLISKEVVLIGILVVVLTSISVVVVLLHSK